MSSVPCPNLSAMREFTANSVSITHPTYIILHSSFNMLCVACEDNGAIIANRPVAALWQKFLILGDIYQLFGMKTWKNTYISLDHLGMLTSSSVSDAALLKCTNGILEAISYKKINAGPVKVGTDAQLRVHDSVVGVIADIEPPVLYPIVLSVLPPERISLVVDSAKYVYATSDGLLSSL